jgi:hypothetical protein
LTFCLQAWATAAEPPADFQPQELSIGEPISLPNAAPLPAARDTSPPARGLPATGQLQPPTIPSAAGTGWLGIAVDDTVLTGRLVVVEVAPDSPAAMAGVRQQDVLLAINGKQLQTADEMAAALAAISPGQRVKAAVGRDNKVDDLVMTAAPRPAEAMARNWQSAADATTVAPLARSMPATPETLPMSATPRPPAASAPADLRQPALPPAVTPSAIPSVVAAAPLQPSAAPGLPQAAPVAAFTAPPPATAAPSTRDAAVLTPPAFPPAVAVQPQLVAPPAAGPAPAGGRLALGVRTVPVDSAVQSRFQMPRAQGAFVIGVVDDLPAAKAGVPPGSVIVALNQQPVGSPQELTQLVARGPAGRPVPLDYVLPGGQSRQATVVLQSLDEPLERALVGSVPTPTSAAPLQPAPQPFALPAAEIARRLEPPLPAQPSDGSLPSRQEETSRAESRLEEMLRRLETRLDSIDRRLQRLESGR